MTISELKDEFNPEDKTDSVLIALIDKCQKEKISDIDVLKLLNNSIEEVKESGLDAAKEKFNNFLENYDYDTYHKNKESHGSLLGDHINNAVNDNLNNAQIPKIEFDNKTRISKIISTLVNNIKKSGAVITGKNGEQEEVEYNTDFIQKEIINLKKLLDTLENKKTNLTAIASDTSNQDKLDLLIKTRNL